MSIEKQTITPKSKKAPKKARDPLKRMFEVQRDFHSRVNPTFEVMWPAQREELLVKTSRNIMMEAAELMDELNWKEWKRARKEVDMEQVRYEIADLMAFVMNACIEAGMGHEDLFRYYMQKAAINVERQDRKY